MDCLEIARDIHAKTAGAFDISVGTGLPSLELSRRHWTVRATAAGVRIDLGGIGKGYAIDRMAEVLEEWEIGAALLHGGHSSVLALDAPPGLEGWPLAIGERTVQACRRALSASGVRSQGRHIIDPRTGQPANARTAAWVTVELGGHPSPAALAEAYSTAFMILPAEQVKAICARHPGLEGYLLENACVQDS